MVREQKKMRMIALRGLTVLPHTMVHLDISRKLSLETANQAMNEDQMIFLVCQKDKEMMHPEQKDLYQVGTVAKIRQIVKIPAGPVRVLVEGLERARLEHMEEENPSVSEEEKIRFLKQIYGEIRECTKCPLCSYRKNAVPGMGSTTPLVMAIGEGPGADEDEQGLPFVGKAGQLLDKMLTAINLSRKKNVYIANVVKCRPPNNRTPTVNETSACLPFLKRQIEILKPKLILALGRTAVQALLNTTEGINFYRGKVVKYNNSILLMATYHPSALLRDEHLKRPAWEDLKKFRQLILSVDPDYENTFTESPTKDTGSGV